MRPIKAVAVGREGSSLVLKLETGQTIKTRKSKKLKLLVGHVCNVFYDFTEGRVRKIERFDSQAELKEDDTVAIEQVDIPEDGDPPVVVKDDQPAEEEGKWQFRGHLDFGSGALLTGL